MVQGPNTLTADIVLKGGPILVDELVRHFVNKLTDRSAHRGKGKEKATGNLKKDELMYAQGFRIVKAFMASGARHTVEEIQEFSNTRTPTPPWTKRIEVLIPMSCCDDAVPHLIKALGGEELTKQLVGGTKWWQVRGVQGVNAEWMTLKKDWEKHEKRRQATGSSSHSHKKEGIPASSQAGETKDGDFENGTYAPEMDAMRCILYLHGGGYYFGSTDQGRYAIARHARKINGRILSVNYRLAPQYPFPCAIQDALAAYLYLIHPPAGAAHTAVSPSHIVFGGDSAGGGLALALLQVVRDSGLPLPAGAFLISPWCDLSHSFPSIHENTESDIVPFYGLSLHKPSTLWPPPSEEVTSKVHAGLRSRIAKMSGKEREALSAPSEPEATRSSTLAFSSSPADSTHEMPASPPSRRFSLFQPHLTPTAAVAAEPNGHYVKGDKGDIKIGQTTPLPAPGPHVMVTLDDGTTFSLHDEDILMKTASGEELRVSGQVQLYTVNSLTQHPLVSPCVGYLGGLPPLFIIAGDKEVLRDEIIYTAHRAANANSSEYRLKEREIDMYPAYKDIEKRYGPTKVHLQVYDEGPHILPVLFPFTTPAKYCFRAIATFNRHVTGLTTAAPPPKDSALRIPPLGEKQHVLGKEVVESPSVDVAPDPLASFENGVEKEKVKEVVSPLPPPANAEGLRRQKTLGSRLKDMTSTIRVKKANTVTLPISSSEGSTESQDAAGPRFGNDAKEHGASGPGTAGHRNAYNVNPEGADPFKDNMIRERVSTQGVIRPLEPPEDLPACSLPHEIVGEVNELAMRRYIEGTTSYDKQFGSTIRRIAKERDRQFLKENKKTARTLARLQETSDSGSVRVGSLDSGRDSLSSSRKNSADGFWSWALDKDERPPPSSIVARRDTEEARRLGKVADQSIMPVEKHLSGNSLWSLAANFLTSAPAGAEVSKTDRSASLPAEPVAGAVVDKAEVNGITASKSVADHHA